MGITTNDLARICGVSRTTVLRALNETGRINPETKEYILQIAKENGYRPDLLARGLVKGRTHNIGVVVLDVKNRYFAQMLSIIVAEANKKEYGVNIMLHNNHHDLEKKHLERLTGYRIDGIILSSVNEGEEYKRFLDQLGVPIVSVDNRIAKGIPFVGIDQKEAMKMATEKAIEKGYNNLVFVCPPIHAESSENIYVHKERREGFRLALQNHPELENDSLLDWTYLDNIHERIQSDKKTAFICSADDFALAIMKELKKFKKAAGKDYGIIGFDDIDTLEYVLPRLSTVSNSVDLVGQKAVELLLSMIESNNKEYSVQDNILPYAYIEGETL